jgi:large subunit ribosomal protein L10
VSFTKIKIDPCGTNLYCVASMFLSHRLYNLLSYFPSVYDFPHQTVFMSVAAGASTLEHKKEKVSRVKSLLDSSLMIFSVPGSSLTVKEVQTLRRKLPETTTVSVVKNKLMARALEGTDFNAASGTLLKGSNMWFFIQEDIQGSMKVFQEFVKESNKKDTHFPMGGVIEGDLLDSAGVIAVSKLPSKKELYAKIAGSIKQVPTKLARVVKATPTKLARAIKLATEEKKEE